MVRMKTVDEILAGIRQMRENLTKEEIEEFEFWHDLIAGREVIVKADRDGKNDDRKI